MNTPKDSTKYITDQKIALNVLLGGRRYGLEYCRDCAWSRIINRFPSYSQETWEKFYDSLDKDTTERFNVIYERIKQIIYKEYDIEEETYANKQKS